MSENTKCFYFKQNKCKECTHVVFNECPKYRASLVRSYCEELAPMVLRSCAYLPMRVVYGYYSIQKPIYGYSDLKAYPQYVNMRDLMKSFCVRLGVAQKLPVKIMDYNNVVDACFGFSRGDYEYSRCIYFIEAWGGVQRTDVNNTAVFDSFIATALSVGAYVYLLTTSVKITMHSGWAVVGKNDKVIVERAGKDGGLTSDVLQGGVTAKNRIQ